MHIISNTPRTYPFSMATVTVLGCVESCNGLVPYRVEDLLRNVEIWPARPGPDDRFTFGWKDLGILDSFFPIDLAKRRFTIRLAGLHMLMNDFLNTGNPSWMKEQEQYMMDDLNFDDCTIHDWSDSEGDMDFLSDSEDEESDRNGTGDEFEMMDVVGGTKSEEAVGGMNRQVNDGECSD